MRDLGLGIVSHERGDDILRQGLESFLQEQLRRLQARPSFLVLGRHRGRAIQQDDKASGSLSPALAEQVKVAALNTEDPGHFADLVAANLNLSLEDRQEL